MLDMLLLENEMLMIAVSRLDAQTLRDADRAYVESGGSFRSENFAAMSKHVDDGTVAGPDGESEALLAELSP